MSDINCIEYSFTIPVTNVGLYDRSSLSIDAKDAAKTVSVFVNGVKTPSFVVVSSTNIIAVIPSSESGKAITSVSLVGKSGDVGVLTFNAKNSNPINDANYVIQRFFRFLLMDKGSDVFNPTYGVGMLSALGALTMEDVEVYVSSCIRDAEAQLLSTQYPELPDSKTLVMVSVVNISYSVNTLTAAVSLRFRLADGTNLNTNFNVAG